jgi:mycofactocin system glycosyltransferase
MENNPLLYTLRKEIRFEEEKDSWVVISETPLNVVRVRKRAVDVLRLCDGSRTLAQIALEAAMTEEQVFRLCDYFNRKAIVEIIPARGGDYFPSVTVIIPVKDRRVELAHCLESLFAQNYPGDAFDVIVIDDGSGDGTGDLARRYPCRVLSLEKSMGQSYCRNLGAKIADGDVLAFIDSDCVAEKNWLREIVTYFQWKRIGAVAGYVDGYFEETGLDRYEKVFSPLRMGEYVLYGSDTGSTFYAPTCNLLVRKDVYIKNGGIRDDMHVGEDVDFCWRMRSGGHDLLYVPRGPVKHKHRNTLGKMLKRRCDYGTSEAMLHALHPEKTKVLQAPPLAAMSFLALCLALLLHSVSLLVITGGCFLVEAGVKVKKMREFDIPAGKVLFSVLRSYFSFFYFASFHVVRYYILLLLLLGFALPSFWPLSLLMLLLAFSVDYAVKGPRISFPKALFYYALEHMSYQLGVFLGCVRGKTFGCYAARFVRRIGGAL